MKITTRQLRSLIAEEARRCLTEAESLRNVAVKMIPDRKISVEKTGETAAVPTIIVKVGAEVVLELQPVEGKSLQEGLYSAQDYGQGAVVTVDGQPVVTLTSHEVGNLAHSLGKAIGPLFNQ